MKHYKLAFYILLISFIWISCENDDIAPEIKINAPLENTAFRAYQILILDADVTDNEELDFLSITLTGPGDITSLRKIELSGDSQCILEEFELAYDESGLISMNIEAVDKAGNRTSVVQTFEYQYGDIGTLDLNIKLEYKGEPLVMFDAYQYPDGKAIDFTRCSFYTSEMKLDETLINQVEFHNLTNFHSELSLSTMGYPWNINTVPTGSYNSLSFNIGVPTIWNNQDPGKFPSGHPLAKPAENWFSWMSYIFLKVEGNVDLDDDGEAEEGFALHTGSNEALRNISLDIPIEIKTNEVTRIDLVFDLYQLFDGPTGIFPIEENPQIHSLSQMDAVVELSNNLTNAIDNI